MSCHVKSFTRAYLAIHRLRLARCTIRRSGSPRINSTIQLGNTLKPCTVYNALDDLNLLHLPPSYIAVINKNKCSYTVVLCIDAPLCYRQSCTEKNLSFCDKETFTQSRSPCSLRAVGNMKVTRLVIPKARHSPVVMKYPSRSVIQVPPMSEHIAFPCSETHSAA